MNIPQLILNEFFGQNPERVISEINGYEFRGELKSDEEYFSVCRVGGYQFIRQEDNTVEMLAWQCNFADIQNYDIQLPTILSISIDQNGIISDIDLHNCFKGSQGIPCCHKYLNRRVKKYIGEKFDVLSKTLSDPLGTGCRHTFELLFGACAFYNKCYSDSVSKAWISETTSAIITDEGIIAIDRLSINGNESLTKLDISNYKESINYCESGAICSCQNMLINGYNLMGDKIEMIGAPKTLSADSKDKFIMKLMKLLSKYWLSSGKNVNVSGHFYYSQLWPPTLFGILTQAFAISIFGNSYSYFQHCIMGMQKDENSCNCIGVCEDIDECSKYFPDFTIEDLY